MKFALAICCLAAVVVFTNASDQKTSAEILDEIAKTSKECAEKFNISDETLKKLDETVDKTTFDASDDLKCFNKCGGEKIGLFVDGKMQIERLVEVHVALGREESQIREYAALCKDQFARPIDCSTSWDAYTCFHNKL